MRWKTTNKQASKKLSFMINPRIQTYTQNLDSNQNSGGSQISLQSKIETSPLSRRNYKGDVQERFRLISFVRAFVQLSYDYWPGKFRQNLYNFIEQYLRRL